MAARRFPLRLALLVLLGASTSCGPETPQTVPVTGRITYGGGPWPTSGRLMFPCLAPAPGFPCRPGHAVLNTDGDFTAAAYEQGSGLHPGKYVVHVECWEVPPSMDDPTAGKSYVPADFHHEFEVLPDDAHVELNLDVPKPKRG